MNVWNVLRQLFRAVARVNGLKLGRASSLAAMLIIMMSASAQAANFQWNGRYNFEALAIDKPRLEDGTSSKAYALHHLILRPKIVASDGFLIRSRFDILNQNGFTNSGLGQKLGVGPRGAAAGGTTTDATNSNTAAQTLASDMIAINELYLTWIHEFGALVVGRAPLQFGLGMTYNAGTGPFDHWFDNRDMAAYKIQMGNFYIMPMYAKVDEGAVGGEDDVNDYMVQLEYNNKESGLAMGFFHQSRRAAQGGSDFPTGPFGAGAVTGFGAEGFEGSQNSIFVRQKVSDFNVGLEAGFTSGKAGVKDASGNEVRFNGYGVALEIDWVRENSDWTINLRAGAASGDDPNTTDAYEGFIFDRNYDVAMLLFNHPIGNYDIFRTGLDRGTATTAEQSFDTESLSNVIYLAPQFVYKGGEQWDLRGTFITAFINQDPLGGGVSDDVGYEFDLSLEYRPTNRIKLTADVGFLQPGDAFKGGTSDFANDFIYGVATKAAISF